MRLISVASVLTSTFCAQAPKSLQLCGVAARGQGPRDPGGEKEQKGEGENGGQGGEWPSSGRKGKKRWNKQRAGQMNSIGQRDQIPPQIGRFCAEVTYEGHVDSSSALK